MSKKKIGIICAVIAAAAVLIICLKIFAFPQAGSSDSVVYVNPVSRLMGLGSGNGMINRFQGVVESQETWSVQQNPDKKVKEILVSVGQEVSAGTPLFTYDTEQFQSDLAQAQIDLERLQNEVTNMNAAIAELEKQRDKAPASDKATYNLQIQEQQLQVKQKEFDVKSKQLEIDKLNENINNATVSSEIAGVIKSINSGNGTDVYGNSDDSFITVMKTGQFRIKGKMNEQNMGSLSEGTAVIVHSRTDEAQTWKGTVSKIDWDNPEANSSSMYYASSSDSGVSSSSNYSFYVELENSDGLKMGQHVYIEPDYGQSEVKEGVWLDEYLIDMSDPQNPFVWAANGNERLEKSPVKLGEHDDELMQYQILEGLSEEDAVTFPEEGLEEGMTTVISTDGSMGQAVTETPEDGAVDGTDTDNNVSVDGGISVDEGISVDGGMAFDSTVAR
jgi:HlyD family secretion protein